MTAVADMKTLDKVFSPNVGHDLVVVALSFGQVPAEAVLDGSAKPIEARLSADGRSWESAWHEGELSGRECYVERHDATGCVFHGWIDQASRRLVQAG